MKSGAHKKKIVFAAVGLCVVILAAAAAFWPGEKEPEFKGKKLTELSRQSPMDQDGIEAIIALGTNSLPLLVKWASYEPTKFRETLDSCWARIPRPFRDNRVADWILLDRGGDRRSAAIQIFGMLGPRANSVIPDLAAVARKGTNSYALMCLQGIGEGAFPALAEMAKDSSFSGRTDAVNCIGSMDDAGTNEMAAVRLLITLAEESDEYMAVRAINTLGLLNWKRDEALKTLMNFVGNENPALITCAVVGIRNFGTNARPVVPQLIEILSHKNPDVREVVTNTINTIAPEFFATSGIVIPEIERCVWPR